jgi:hypothetical protein
MKYLAQVTIQNNGGCYRFNSDSLDAIRVWAKTVGKAGDELFIMPNGKTTAEGRTFVL